MSCIGNYFRVALVALALQSPAEAQGETLSPSEHLLLMLVSSENEAESLRSSSIAEDLSKQIEDIGVSVKLKRVEGAGSKPGSLIDAARAQPGKGGAIGCFSLVKSTTGTSFHLVLFDQKSEWSVVRHLDELDTETLVETLAVIIRTSLTVFMMDLDKRKEAPRTEPAPSPVSKPSDSPVNALPSSPVKRYRLEIGVGYDFSMIAEELSPIHGVLLTGAVAANRMVSFYGSYVVSFPLKYEDENAYLRSVHHPARVGVSLRTLWSRFNLRGGVAFGINYVTHEHRGARDGMTALEQGGYLQLSVAPALALEVSIIDQLGLFFAAGADILLRRPRYLHEQEGEIDVIADPWPVTPRISVGVSWRLLKVEQ